MKKAYLVNYSITRRVELDTDGLNEDEIAEELHEIASEKIMHYGLLDNYVCADNMEFKEDKEYPIQNVE
jgi:hypothetical protein